jgi:glycosyltransferase involved in cell wall biosynthesis
MKIVLVHNQYQQPGGEDVVARQEHQLLERAGHTVVLYQRSNWEVNSYNGLKQLALASKTIWANEVRKEFLELLRAENPDVVHVHNTFMMISPSIFSACREAGVPVVHTLHNYRLLCPAATLFRDGKVCEECIDNSLWSSIRHGCYRNSRAATATVALMLAVHRGLNTWANDVTCHVALTEFAREKFLQRGLSADKLFVKPNFVHPDPLPGTGEGNYVLFAGRLTPEKRISTVLLAMKRLSQDIPLVIVGGGPQQAQLEKEAAEYGLTNINFRGQLSREDTLDAMRNARFLIFSSEWYETFGMTIAESFACSIPVICSRLGAMQEIVEDGRTGLHFTPGDADDLATKIDWAWNNPARVRELGAQARKEYEAKYTAETNYPLLMDIYTRAINANCAGLCSSA